MTKQTSNIIKAAKLLKKGVNVIYLINEKNGYQLFTFAYWQCRVGTLRSFRTIVYAREKDMLYWILKIFSIVSFGYHRLILKVS